MPLNFKKYAEHAEDFLKELSQRLGDDNRDRSARILRSVLHLLRDQIPVEESVQFMAQLPMFLKAVYVDGWKLNNRQRKVKDYDAFINEIRYPDTRKIYTDFDSNAQCEHAVQIVLTLIQEKVSEGEIRDVVNTLPAGLRKIFEIKAMH